MNLIGGMNSNMNTLYRLAFYIMILLILFNLGWGVLRGLDGTVYAESADHNIIEEETDNDIFTELTGLSGDALNMFSIAAVAGMAGAAVFAYMVQSLTPVALYIFGVGFWMSYNATVTTINLNGWIPESLMLMVTVTMIFLFMGAIIGLITGNG